MLLILMKTMAEKSVVGSLLSHVKTSWPHQQSSFVPSQMLVSLSVIQAGRGRDGLCLLMSSGASEARLEGRVLPSSPCFLSYVSASWSGSGSRSQSTHVETLCALGVIKYNGDPIRELCGGPSLMAHPQQLCSIPSRVFYCPGQLERSSSLSLRQGA